MITNRHGRPYSDAVHKAALDFTLSVSFQKVEESYIKIAGSDFDITAQHGDNNTLYMAAYTNDISPVEAQWVEASGFLQRETYTLPLKVKGKDVEVGCTMVGLIERTEEGDMYEVRLTSPDLKTLHPNAVPAVLIPK